MDKRVSPSPRFVSNQLGDDNMARVCRIMAEFAEGFETPDSFAPGVSILDSPKAKPTGPLYALAEELGRPSAEKVFSVITGTAPGLMDGSQ